MAVLIREPPRADGPTRRVSLQASIDELDVSAIARKAAAGAPAGGRVLERALGRRDHRVRRRRVRARERGNVDRDRERVRPRDCVVVPPRALQPSGVLLVDKPAGPSSFSIVSAVRRRTGATGHAGTLDPFATGPSSCCPSGTKLASCFVGLDKRYLTDIDLAARTSTWWTPRERSSWRCGATRAGRPGALARGPPG